MNQKKLRVDDYFHQRAAIADDGNAWNLGKLVIIPSALLGVHVICTKELRSQNAMTYV